MIYYNPYFPQFHNFNNKLKNQDTPLPQANLNNSNLKKGPLSDIYSLFSSTDNLIILGLIFVLMKQKNTSKALLLCLVLLLFDD